MTKQNEVYKCGVCGNIVEVLHTGAGELVCCGKPMNLQNEKSHDEGEEKHLPVIEKEGDKLIVKVGSIPHPMEEDHYIEWIEAVSDKGEVAKVFLKPGDLPEAEFGFDVMSAREYCNLHGLWVNE